MEKRGLSPVVANVLVILLVIAAIAILWAVVRPAIEGAGEQITTGTSCVALILNIEGCASDSLVGTVPPGLLTIDVRRSAGGGDIGTMKVIVDGTPQDPVDDTIVPDELETVTITTAGNEDASIQVAAVLADGKVCEPTTQTVTCTGP
jgi:hypothetical protein